MDDPIAEGSKSRMVGPGRSRSWSRLSTTFARMKHGFQGTCPVSCFGGTAHGKQTVKLGLLYQTLSQKHMDTT